MGASAKTSGTDQARAKAILVLGMHRSGTSLVSGCLSLAGIDFGRGLMRPDASNPKGHWEQTDIVVVHKQLLESFDMSWESVGALPPGWLDHPNTVQAEKEIRSIIAAKFSSSKLWAVKDPRLCRFLPLWERILDKLQIQPIYLYVVRDPQESALSLQKRNEFSIEKGRALWATYNYDIFREFSKVNKHALILFSNFVENPVSNVEKILEVVGDKLTLNSGSKKAIRAFCDGSLRHHKVEKAKPAVADNADLFYTKVARYGALDRSSKIDSCWLSYTGEIERTLVRKQADYAVASKVLENLGDYVSAEIYFPDSKGNLAARNSEVRLIPSGAWHPVVFELKGSHAIAKHGFRFDPCNAPGELKISSWSIRRRDTGKILAEQSTWEDVAVKGHGIRVALEDQPLTVISYGEDPQIFFPPQNIVEGVPLTLQFWVHYDRSMPLMQSQLARLSVLESEMTASGLRQKELSEELEALQAQIVALTSEAERVPGMEAELAKQADREKALREELEQGKAYGEDLRAEAERVRGLEAELAEQAERENALKEELGQVRVRSEELNATAERVPGLEVTLAEHAGRERALCEELEQVKSRNEELEAKLAEHVGREQALCEELEQVKSRNEELEAKLTEHAGRENALREELEQVKSRNVEVGAIAERVPGLKAELAGQAGREKALREELERLKVRSKELEATAERIKDLRLRLEEYESEEEDLTEEIKEICDHYDDFKVQAARLSAIEALVQHDAIRSFRQHCLRPINPLRKFTSRRLRWLDRLLPRACLRVDTLPIAYNKREATGALQRILYKKQFDAAWYLENYPDVRDYKFSPFYHYLNQGWKEGRNPSPRFNARGYLKKRPDVAARGVEPLTHHLKYGKSETEATR